MMKKIILGAGVFTSVVASTLGDTCSRCGKEMVVSSREPGMCIDCYRDYILKRPRCKDCGNTIDGNPYQERCINCFQINVQKRPECISCRKHAVGRKGEVCYVCRTRAEGGDKEICCYCKNDTTMVGNSHNLCSGCWKDSCHSVCPKCHAGQLGIPSYPMCDACWKKDDASLCKKCKEGRCDNGSDLCVRCWRQSVCFDCGGGLGCTDDHTSGFDCDDSHGSFGCDEPYVKP